MYKGTILLPLIGILFRKFGDSSIPCHRLETDLFSGRIVGLHIVFWCIMGINEM
ncbi:hypothetical protein HanPSC8_Chr10g0429901 [Helianthus annuus]|nr:hypothetical protein HanPSC8_Chr10g0429901 [Helianthus annuus]